MKRADRLAHQNHLRWQRRRAGISGLIRHGVTRRGFLQSLALLMVPPPSLEPIPGDLATPHKANRLLIAPSRESGAFDSHGADVPFVFRHDDKFHMTYVGFDGEGYQTGLAVSSNLLDWHKEGVILARDPLHPVLRYNAALTWILRENDVFSPGALHKIHGRYLGVYHAYPKPGYEEGPAVIGLCWSSDLRNWEVEEPCLLPDDGGSWENGGLYKACILEHEGTYYLFYNAKDRTQRWKEQTGFAFSRDLKHWTRFEGNPILTNGPAGSPDEIFASDPCVLRYRDRWAIFYYGLDEKGVARDLLALSPDLRRTTKSSGALVDVGPPGSVDSKYAHKPSVVFHQGTLFHFYCAVSNEFGRGISVAASRPV